MTSGRSVRSRLIAAGGLRRTDHRPVRGGAGSGGGRRAAPFFPRSACPTRRARPPTRRGSTPTTAPPARRTHRPRAQGRHRPRGARRHRARLAVRGALGHGRPVEGWRTGYYHMENIQVSDGQQVARAPRSARSATRCRAAARAAARTCTSRCGADRFRRRAGREPGGRRRLGRRVLRTLSSDVAAVLGEPIDGKVFGGWQFSEGAGSTRATSSGRATADVPFPGTFLYG